MGVVSQARAVNQPMVTPKIATERPAPSVCLCVPTFRRPDGLRKLLAHVGRLRYPGALTVIVIDNDAAGQAGIAVVNALAPTFRFPLTAMVEPNRGQTYAYNRGFVSACRTAPAPDYVAVLDDDEYPDPDWLSTMIDVALGHDVDIVGGPVFPVFDLPDHWLAKSGILAPVRHKTGRVEMIYGAGNMLIRRDVLEQYLDEPFHHDFAFTGASDYDFFWRCRRDGRSFGWADEARVLETTPAERTTMRYVLFRKFRNGTEATRIDRKAGGKITAPLRRWCIGLGLLAVGTMSLPIALFRGRQAIMRSLMRAARGAGRIAAEFDIHYEQYR